MAVDSWLSVQSKIKGSSVRERWTMFVDDGRCSWTMFVTNTAPELDYRMNSTFPIKKMYAVHIGREPGVYHSWEECKQQVVYYSNAKYKKFKTYKRKKYNITSCKKILFKKKA